MASYDEYYRANLENGQQRLDEENAAAKKRNEELMRQIGAAIDQSVGAQENTYQQSIDAAPSRFQSAYDANTIGELIGRRQLQESMANLGLTDSGLSRTQDTALTVARQNADASTRAGQTEYVNKLKSAIDMVRANAAAQKAEKQIALDTERDSWYRKAIAQMQSDAQTAAAKAWEADQTYAAEKYKADTEAAAAVEKARYEALTAQAKASSTAGTKNDQNRLSYAKALMTKGLSEGEAWTYAVARYPYDNSSAENKKTNSYSSAYANAKNSGYSEENAKIYANAIKSGKTEQEAKSLADNAQRLDSAEKFVDSLGEWDDDSSWIGGIFNNTAFRNADDDGRFVAARTKTGYAKKEGFQKLDAKTQEYAVAYGVAKAITTRWAKDMANDHEKILRRVNGACENLNSTQAKIVRQYVNDRLK